MNLIRPLSEQDVDAVHHLGSNERSFSFEGQTFWSKDQLERWFQSEDDVCLGAFEGEEAIGFTLAAMHQATRKVTWENLYVIPSKRDTGVSEALIHEMMNQLTAKGATYVHCLVDNERKKLHAYFQTFGFEANGAFMWLGQAIKAPHKQ